MFQDNSTNEPSENFVAGSGGRVTFAAEPNSDSYFSFDGVGTFAFATLGATNTFALADVVDGDVLELPGTTVEGVTFGATSLTIAIDAGTYAFTDVTFESGTGVQLPDNFTAALDPRQNPRSTS